MIAVDIITLALLAAIGYAGFLVGQVVGQRKKPTGPVCPCTHVWGMHKEGGKCMADVKRRDYDIPLFAKEWVRCPCAKYHGPALVDDQFFYPGTHVGDS